ncbi:hypothetical protein EDC04DRAFT_2917974 [Pisolithus marmoratus]|nr:hypothetical protein EDC04DRAFT_2917974 [Pisolithus marmoratus]
MKKGKKLYIIKDYWMHKGSKHVEEEILLKIKGLLGVSQLIKAWTIQTEGADEMTDWLQPTFLVRNMEFETCLHQCLLLSPVGDLLFQFHSLQELVSIFIDIIQNVYNILHHDISINNILMFTCTTRWATASDDQEEWESVIANKKFQHGLLIDFDYADMLNAKKKGVSSESLIYVFIWMCILYQAPNEIHSDWAIEQTCLKQWALAKMTMEIQALCDQRIGQLSSRSVLSDFMPYFNPLKPAITRLYKLIQLSHDSGDKFILNHTAIMEVLMDAFKTVTEVSCSMTNAKRTWQCLQKEPAPTGSQYYSEGCNACCKVM